MADLAQVCCYCGSGLARGSAGHSVRIATEETKHYLKKQKPKLNKRLTRLCKHPLGANRYDFIRIL